MSEAKSGIAISTDHQPPHSAEFTLGRAKGATRGLHARYANSKCTALAISGAMHDRQHDYFAACFINPINDQVWIFYEFERARDETRPAHVRESVYFKCVDTVPNLRHHSSRRAGVVLGDLSKNTVEIIVRRSADNDPHTP